MASVQRRREDLYRVKTRELVFQYPDGSYPGLYRVAVIENGLGNVDWSPATIDMSGNMQLPGNLDVSGSATVDGTLTVGSTIYALSDVAVAGDLDVSGSATVDGTLTVGSTIYALSDVAVDGDLDVSGSLTVSSIETCALSASQGRFTVDCSYGYVSIQPNTGLPPGVTAGSYNDSRIDMYCSNGITAQRSRLRLFAQERYDTAVTEGRLALIDSSDEYITPAIQFDASAEQLRILNYNLNEEVAVAVSLNGQMSIGGTYQDPNTRLTVIGQESIIMTSPPVGSTADRDAILRCVYAPSLGTTLTPHIQSLFIFPNQSSVGTTGMNIVSAEFIPGVGAYTAGAPLILNPEMPTMITERGNVGVGTTEPETMLDVYGAMVVGQSRYLNYLLTVDAIGITFNNTNPGQVAAFKDLSGNEIVSIYTEPYNSSSSADWDYAAGGVLHVARDTVTDVSVAASGHYRTLQDIIIRAGGASPPATSTYPGVTGQITWGQDGGTYYLYTCVTGSSWMRVPMSSW